MADAGAKSVPNVPLLYPPSWFTDPRGGILANLSGEIRLNRKSSA